MLEGILGNATAEKVLLYLEQYGEGYARAIAVTFDELPRQHGPAAASAAGGGGNPRQSAQGPDAPLRLEPALHVS